MKTTKPALIKPALVLLTLTTLPVGSGALADDPAAVWEVDFFDDFDTFNHEYWHDQLLWVNNEDQCYVREGQFDTREVSEGTLKLRVVDLGEPRICFNWDKKGIQHPPTRYMAGRIASKNRKEFARGKWTARLRVRDSGQAGMFPAWWLLGAFNNEPPIDEPDETICWPVRGSGEIDIFEHHSDGGPDHYAARSIKSLGYCDGGDWQSKMLVLGADLDAFHEYSVEWEGDDLLFRLDGEAVYRLEGEGANLPEPMFAILNFAKINASPMTVERWEMEVDWVKHERRVNP
jgi:beta-glucanase (GH16 family)